ncbi:MAG TPA: hypothetical protein VJQ86_06055 [Rhodanobacteraceae bacterium]|nr:hypothetical protein [Rhodanobacteraceae bacterium]
MDVKAKAKSPGLLAPSMALARRAIGFADVRSDILPPQSDRRCAASGMAPLTYRPSLA